VQNPHPAPRVPVVLVVPAALLVLLAGCTAPAEHPALKDARLPPLTQAHRYAWRTEAQRGHQLSPDGRKLAWIGPHYFRSALFVRDNDSGEIRRYRVMSGSLQWTVDSRRLLSAATDTSGAENTHVYMLDTADPAAVPVDLTPYPGVKAAIHQIPAADPAQLLVSHNRRDHKVFDLYRIDLNTRQETLVAKNPGDAVAPLTTRSGGFEGWQQSRAAQRPSAERALPRAQRQPELTARPDESFRALGTSRDGTTHWALSNRGRERIALVAVDRKMQWEKVVFDHPHVDVSRVTLSRVSGAPLVAYAQPGLPQAVILDAALRADLDPLLKAQGGEPHSLEILSTDAAEQRMIILIYTSATRRYYLLDRAQRSHQLLAEDSAEAAADTLAKVQPVTFAARDGLPLYGYLTLPRGVAAKRLPLVLLVHGGPWLRSGNPLRSEDADNARFLANRGYAVLQVDFRGSTGYGKHHLAAAIGEFAGKMHEDLLDAVRWAVDGGFADPARVAIMGWSYGGYAAMVGMTLTPETFACGVSIGGPTDLATLIESFPPYWQTDLTQWHDYVGNPAIAQDREDMTRRSPLTHAAKLERPLLLVHGGKDVRVRIDQAERMAAALRQAGKPVEYLPIADMGHGASWWVHRQVFLRKTETFLHGCLGGRASRFDPLDAVAWVWWRASG
jgi:dipeptidyl aminopeptidase/acylaminoacyl peptidase